MRSTIRLNSPDRRIFRNAAWNASTVAGAVSLLNVI